MDETVIGISLNSVADDRGSSLRLEVAVVVIGTSLSTVGTELEAKDNFLEGIGEEMETSFRVMLEASTGMAVTSFFEVSSPNRDSENFLRKKKRHCNLQPSMEEFRKFQFEKKRIRNKIFSFCGYRYSRKIILPLFKQ